MLLFSSLVYFAVQLRCSGLIIPAIYEKPFTLKTISAVFSLIFSLHIALYSMHTLFIYLSDYTF